MRLTGQGNGFPDFDVNNVRGSDFEIRWGLYVQQDPGPIVRRLWRSVQEEDFTLVPAVIRITDIS